MNSRRRVNSTVMWFPIMPMKHQHYRAIPLAFIVLLLSSIAGAAPRIKLTDRDRAAIVGSVTRDLFRVGRNYEGKHFILVDGIQPNWIPRIPGYDISLVTRNEIESARAPIYYYVFW